MKLSLFLASMLLALLALEQVNAHDTNDANDTDKIPPGMKFEKEKIPENRRLKNMKKENPAEMRKLMKEKGLIDISEGKGLVPLITAKDGSNVPNQYIAHLKPCGKYGKSWHASRFSNSRDYDGHGTHVASTLGGATYGVAKEVNIIPVKVCAHVKSCFNSDIVEGLYWIKSRVQRYKRLSVVNMSLSGWYSSYMNDAVYAVLYAGIPVAVAAGNEHKYNACYKSPASVRWALTVGATDINDYVASFSNIGPCVDIYAPGTKIRAAYYAHNYGWLEIGGTSMASPLVAGAVAGMLQVFQDAGYYRVPSISLVDDISYNIIKFAEKGTVRGLPSTNNNNVMLQTMCLTT
ncbi:uncharacterized protein LOC106170846 [Lingula anatina]|uniref:Uncharacterized protein LOC106170846 n=1 Tax=Lingula anatina TaxID=7574 RepID=A0A1S3J7B8_LINAN|nr:uncharacterized protein LOC106170846 [Lingula anatina]|eukprot:XP_013406295.1 uncharacterized protein LOC106170846 [Lingula anatina]